jgi:2-polyprenyl-3-methyl-5-hydroxy-6-metoxy-1,4-benzoquinol methylase
MAGTRRVRSQARAYSSTSAACRDGIHAGRQGGRHVTRHAPHAEVWSRDDLEEVTACPVCGQPPGGRRLNGVPDSLRPEQGNRWGFDICSTCDCAHLNPRPTRAAIGRAYEQYFTHSAPSLPSEPTSAASRWRRGARKAEWHRRLGYPEPAVMPRMSGLLRVLPWGRAAAARVVRSVPAALPDSLLIDVGCANGEYLLQMRELGWRVEGIETDPVARGHAEDAGIPVRAGTLDASIESECADALTLGHVIEHVHDPAALLRECLRVLRPGGILWLATPNVRASGLREFGTSYVQLDPPRHLALFSRSALRALLHREGFEDLRDAGVVPQASAWTYARSHAIRQGLGSHPDRLPVLPLRLRVKALLADLRASAQAQHAEEIVLTARKPTR